MEVKNVSVKDILPYENNPRKNEDAVEYVMNSIRDFGFKQPLVLDKNYVIIVGHTRFAAAKKLGYKEVPCIIADDLSEEKARAYRLADNKTNEFAEWDNKELQEELDALFESIQMDRYGFSIQIENIDLKGELEESEQKIARELGEANNYVVLEFFTENEWDRAQELFELERVATPDKNKNIRRYGIGRVIPGAKWLDVLERAMLEEEKEMEEDDEH